MSGKISIKKHIRGYPELKQEFLDSLNKPLTKAEKRKGKIPLTSQQKREALAGWKNGFQTAYETHVDWYNNMPGFKEPEYRIHPLLGHQVRSRHRYIPEGKSQAERLLDKKTILRRKPTVTPYDLDPAYRDPQDSFLESGDLIGVKQDSVVIKDLTVYPEPDFDEIKSDRLREAAETLKFTIGFDHRSNRKVLYSPLKFNIIWDQAAKAMWMRSIGMTPKRIAGALKRPVNTVKTWLKTLTGQPLVRATMFDWSVRHYDGIPARATKYSEVEAKYYSPEQVLQSSEFYHSNDNFHKGGKRDDIKQ